MFQWSSSLEFGKYLNISANINEQNQTWVLICYDMLKPFFFNPMAYVLQNVVELEWLMVL